jgi:hypothetical protein
MRVYTSHADERERMGVHRPCQLRKEGPVVAVVDERKILVDGSPHSLLCEGAADGLVDRWTMD